MPFIFVIYKFATSGKLQKELKSKDKELAESFEIVKEELDLDLSPSANVNNFHLFALITIFMVRHKIFAFCCGVFLVLILLMFFI
jgi:hypothetical protein